MYYTSIWTNTNTWWVLCALVLWRSHLKMVLAKQEQITPKNHMTLDDWREANAKQGDVKDALGPSSDGKEIFTIAGKGGGASWFITPKLDLPKTSYLNISASCSLNCQLELYGQNDSSVKNSKFQPIKNATFNKKTTKNITINTTELFSHLRILARIPSSSSGKESRFTIYSINMYYYYCEERTQYNTTFRRVNSSTEDIDKTVQCQDNSVSSNGGNKSNITVKCTPQGDWNLDDETCDCLKGFQGSATCIRCKNGFYKNTVGNSSCQKCPGGKTNNSMHTECKCKKDHHALGDDDNGPCYAVPSNVTNLLGNTGKTSVNLTWDKPDDKDGELYFGKLTYSIECNNCNLNAMFSPAKKNFTATLVNVSGLKPGRSYTFKVFSMNSLKNVTWRFSTVNVTLSDNNNGPRPTTEDREDPEDPVTKYVVIFVPTGGGIVVIILFIIIIVTRIRRGKSKKSGTDNRGFEGVALPTIGQRTYIDPSNYDDPEAALKDFANEISPKSLFLERVLGGGEFGDVYKGTLKNADGGVIIVAAKTLKHDSDERSKKDFFMEASAMGQFDDPNVIHLEGVITKTIPHMIITEYMSNGSLDNFLKQNDEKLTVLQLIGMARGVASGMKYLAGINFVHRDLAARNILVNDVLLCKVADFGLSRELETADSSRGEYCTTGGKIPVRWTAPESIHYRKFSTASDVWSYGILLWEIMSFGERPYWEWDNFKVLERIDAGYRLPAPKNCPKSVHEVMLLCWENERNDRPDFGHIVRIMDGWIRSPETITEEGSPIRKRPPSEISEWLRDIKMASYIPHFTQAGFTKISELAGLQDNDLQVVGVSLIGHRNKMLRTIRSLSITDQSINSPWKRAGSLKV
ncbi:ephrin type-A receptor 4-like isoform X2 [Dendronephthya gigantea]|nr:ephrin type-A receptor 4-like isoform X2 [Dendronephthya gigantea]XP_028393817.1 ephrin type-A receptor 4-like isoform X2 [Dendronephthya gigantea]XP_028393818.1 ephrin type-A receptor 4-like isoform X2 [Dendronephthya gigantea]